MLSVCIVNLEKIFKSPGKNSQDKAVAEVIGTILIFAIVISLLTTFVMWYVPNVSTSNDQNYQAASETSMIAVASSLSSTNFVSGNTVSFPVSIGIKGVSPFSGPSDTSLNFIGTGFSSSMKVSFIVNYTNSTGIKHNYSLSVNENSSGTLFSSGNTQFINPVDFVIEDGYLLADYGSVQPSSGYGPLPFGIVNNSGHISVSLKSINITGPTISTSGYGSTILELIAENATSLQYSNGGTAAINGTISYVNSIYLSSLNYTVSTPFISAWNFSMYTEYNSSISYSPVRNGTSWLFRSVPFETLIDSGQISVVSLHPMKVHTIDIHYSKLGVISV